MLNKYLNNYLLVFAAATESQGSDTSSIDNLKLTDFEISDLQELIDKINKIEESKEDENNNNNDNLISNIIAETDLEDNKKQKYKVFLNNFLEKSDTNFESVKQKILIVKTKKDPEELKFSFKKNSLLVLFKAMKKLKEGSKDESKEGSKDESKEEDNNKYNEFPVKDLVTAVNGLYLKKFNEDKDYRNNFSNKINSPSDNDEIADDVVKNISNIFSACEAIEKNYYNDKLEQDTKDKLLKGEELNGDVYNKIRRTKGVLAAFVFSLITFIPFLAIGMAGGVGGLSMGLALGFSLIPFFAVIVTGAGLFYKYSSKQGINAKNILKKVAKFKEIIDEQDKVAKSKETINDEQEQKSPELGGSLSASLTYPPQKTGGPYDPDIVTLEEIIDNNDIKVNISPKQSLIYDSLKLTCTQYDKTDNEFHNFFSQLELNLRQNIFKKLTDKSKNKSIIRNITDEFKKELGKEIINPKDINNSTLPDDIVLVLKALNSETYVVEWIKVVENILRNAGITFDDDGTLIVDKPTKKINPAPDGAGTETAKGTTNELDDDEVSQASEGDTGLEDLADLQDHEPVEQNSSQELTSGGGNDGGTRDGGQPQVTGEIEINPKVGDDKKSNNGEGGEVNDDPDQNTGGGGQVNVVLDPIETESSTIRKSIIELEIKLRSIESEKLDNERKIAKLTPEPSRSPTDPAARQSRPAQEENGPTQ